MKQNENIMYQNLWDADTDMLKRNLAQLHILENEKGSMSVI